MGLQQIIRKYNINVINVSLRYVKSNSCENGNKFPFRVPRRNSILSYSPADSVAIVLYIDLNTNKLVDEAVIWTREIIDLTISNHGTYYLPYHIFATKQQFIQAYPLYNQFREAKASLNQKL